MFFKTTLRMLTLIIGLLAVIATAAMGFGSAVEAYGWAFNLGYNPIHLEYCPIITGTALLLATFAFTLFNSRRVQ